MSTIGNNQLIQSINSKILIQRLIVIWALSEAALGGVLHALKIPLTGIFINGTAVLFISLIAYYSDQKGMIIKATLIVLLVKAAVSPHTPLNAYLAVSLQGIIGEILFFRIRFFKFICIVFGIVTLFLSGIQRIVVLTILYGESLWESIDIFANYVIKNMPFVSEHSVNYAISFWLIGLYVGVHIIFGFFIGLFAGKLPIKLDHLKKDNLIDINNSKDKSHVINVKKKPGRFWLSKPSGIAVLILVTAILILTYVYPQFSESVAVKAIIMIIRSVFIMLIWYLVAGPLLLKLYKKYIKKHGTKYSEEIDQTIRLLPFAKIIVVESWKLAKNYKPMKRLQKFIITTIFNVLVLQIADYENNISVNRRQK
jgi:hypothetical protein